MKKSVVFPTIFLFLINLVSAYNGYSRFSITGLFDRIAPADMFLIIFFLIIFLLSKWSLSRVFRDPYGERRTGFSVVLALLVSTAATYGIYRYGFDFESMFYGWGVSSDWLYTLFSILLLILAGIVIWKFGLRGFFLISGAILLLLAFATDFFYEEFTAIIIGLVLILIGIGIGRVFRGVRWIGGKYDWEKEKEQFTAPLRGWRRFRAWRDPRSRLARQDIRRVRERERETRRERDREERRRAREELNRRREERRR
jgi:hypothetical protein